VADEETKEQRQTLQKRVALKEDGYYANCAMVETTPLDVAILFGKVRPVSDANGQRSLVDLYDRQVYLSHLQARALCDALGRSLGALKQPQASQREKLRPERITEGGEERP
jgi:hypothetical protein